jgi:hypothetical protein
VDRKRASRKGLGSSPVHFGPDSRKEDLRKDKIEKNEELNNRS